MQAITKTFYTRIVFMCIFTLTHHLPTISASVSDLSLSTISLPSSSSSSSTPSLVSVSATMSSLSTSSLSAGPVVVTDTATAKSSDASTKTKDLYAIENDVAPAATTTTKKEISISESKSSSATVASTTLFVQQNSSPSSSSSSSLLSPLSQPQKKLATRRQTRSLFYAYPYGTGLYANLYTGCGGCTTYYPSTSYAYSYGYYPAVHKFWGVFNPYYGYPRVIYGR